MLSHLSILLIQFDFIYFFDEVTSYGDRFDDKSGVSESSALRLRQALCFITAS